MVKSTGKKKSKSSGKAASGKSRSTRKRRNTDIFGFEEPSFPEFEMPKVEPPNYDLGIGTALEQKPRPPKKLSKIELISEIARRLNPEQIYDMLIRIGKEKLAKEFIEEIEITQKKYAQMLRAIDTKSEESTSNDDVINAAISILRQIYAAKQNVKDEHQFQTQMDGFLQMVVVHLNEKFAEKGIFWEYDKEYVIRGETHRKRIDFLLKANDLRIGIETKYDLTKTGEFQRLLGQIDEYGRFFDVIIVQTYKDIDREYIRKLKEKARPGLKIFVITPAGYW